MYLYSTNTRQLHLPLKFFSSLSSMSQMSRTRNCPCLLLSLERIFFLFLSFSILRRVSSLFQLSIQLCVFYLIFRFCTWKRLLRLKRRANIKSGERVSQLCFTLYIVHCYLISRLLSLSVLCVISITSSCVCDLLLTLTRRGRCLYLLFRAEDKRETLPDNFAPSLHPLFTCVIPLSGPMFAYLCTVTGEHRHRHRH